MFWADRVAKEIIESRKYKPYWVDDMKTPSGRIHVGSLRGVVIHDLIYKAISNQGKKAYYTYCINDMDPMDGFPIYLDREKFYRYMGRPLFRIPSPQEGYTSFSEYFAKEFIEVFNQIGCFPEIIWTSRLYADGKFNRLIKIYLNNTEKIRQLFKKQYPGFADKDYFPYQPICPSCGKIATTRIYKWDGEYIHFICKKDAIAYTNGCDFEGKIKPEYQNGKLPWKIEWSAHWKTLGITIEWSGKDHMTKGGSHEIASKVSEEILNYPTPHAKSYEHLLLGGKKMSSSKGLGSSAKEVSEIIPPCLLRFLFTRTDYRQAINFEPVGTMVIPDLFDEYDRCWKAYNDGSDEDLSRTVEMSQIGKMPPKKPIFLSRFRDVVNYIQQFTVDLNKKFAEIKGSSLTKGEIEVLQEREKYARIWIEKYAPDEYRYMMTEELPQVAVNLSQKQKEYLRHIIKLVEKEKDAEKLQLDLYNAAKELNLKSSDAFTSIYLSLIGKKHGPKAAWILLQYPKDMIVKRLEEAANQK